jgi:probable O-glycosylation ligase (exosortase A-associated)
MRDLVLVPIIVAICLAALRHPWIGVLGWTWVSLMNPHSYAWVVRDWPIAAFVAGATLLGTLVTSDRRRFFVTPETAFLALFMVWITVTYPFSFNVDGSFGMWAKVLKIDFMILVTIVVLHTRKQIEGLIWVVVLSLAFYGVKGGIFTIMTGGVHRVYGPGGFIEGNNEIALALIIVIPLMRFLQLEAQQKWAKPAWAAAMTLTAIAALGSQSRGALLAIGAMAVFLWLKSPRKLVFGVGIVLVSFLALGLMSDIWDTRMASISNYEEDTSAMGRINAWWMTWNLAKDNFMGGGFDIYTKALFARYAPDPSDLHAAHSVYFQVLGEQGFPGLAIWLLIWVFVWRSASWLIREGARTEETRWCRSLGAMTQVSLVGYAVGGAFLSLAYFDLPYDVLAMVVLAKRWIQEQRAAVDAKSPAPVMTTGLPPVGHAR